MKKQKHKNVEIEKIHALLNMWLKTLDKEEGYWDGVYCSNSHMAYQFAIGRKDSFINWLSANWENLPNNACTGLAPTATQDGTGEAGASQ